LRDPSESRARPDAIVRRGNNSLINSISRTRCERDPLFHRVLHPCYLCYNLSLIAVETLLDVTDAPLKIPYRIFFNDMEIQSIEINDFLYEINKRERERERERERIRTTWPGCCVRILTRARTSAWHSRVNYSAVSSSHRFFSFVTSLARRPRRIP